MKHTIENTKSGVSLGTYEADSEEQALDKMAQDAGYKDYTDLLRQVPDATPDDLEVRTEETS